MISIDQTQTSADRHHDQLGRQGDRPAANLLRCVLWAAAAAAVAVLLWQAGLAAGLAAAAAITGAAQLTTLVAPLSRQVGRIEASTLRWAETTTAQARAAPRRWRGWRPRSRWWRARRAELAATFAVCSGLLAPIYLRLAHDPLAQVVTNNDVYLHIQVAEKMQRWPPEIPHPVFHYLYLAGKPLLGVRWAPLVPVLVATAMMAAGLVRLGATSAHGRPALRGGAVVAFAAVVILTDSPTLLLSASGIIEPTPVMIPHVWWSPTMLLLFGSSLLLVPFVAELVAAAAPTSPTHDRLRRLGPIVLALTVFATLSRPNLTFALVPGLLIYLVRDRRWDRATLTAAMTWLIVPAGLVYLWQTSVVLDNYSSMRGLRINPFYEMAQFQMFVRPWFFYLTAVPTVIAALYARKRFTRDPVVFLTLQAFWFALALMALLDDSQVEQNAHGVYVLPFTSVWLVLWVLTVRFWVGELVAARRAGPAEARKFVIILAGTVVWVAAGVVAHLTAMGVHRFAMI
ncbi:MAG TPA: hypothetical protein VNQ33_01440 [Acidimicrobiales bacterium]|nr:hypothetical protein [Acidimicrobiales bacterium]